MNDHACVPSLGFVVVEQELPADASFARIAEEISPVDKCQEISGESHVKDDMLLSSMYTMHRSLTFVRDKETLPIHLRIFSTSVK